MAVSSADQEKLGFPIEIFNAILRKTETEPAEEIVLFPVRGRKTVLSNLVGKHLIRNQFMSLRKNSSRKTDDSHEQFIK